jgi:hypothetical protein
LMTNQDRNQSHSFHRSCNECYLNTLFDLYRNIHFDRWLYTLH